MAESDYKQLMDLRNERNRYSVVSAATQNTVSSQAFILQDDNKSGMSIGG